jgi:hypothetical protein
MLGLVVMSGLGLVCAASSGLPPFKEWCSSAGAGVQALGLVFRGWGWCWGLAHGVT